MGSTLAEGELRERILAHPLPRHGFEVLRLLQPEAFGAGSAAHGLGGLVRGTPVRFSAAYLTARVAGADPVEAASIATKTVAAFLAQG